MSDMSDLEISERYARIADGFTRRIEAVEPEQWVNRSPCTEWTARDVAAHVVDTHRRVLAALDGGEPDRMDPSSDVVQHWVAARRDLQLALSDPAKATTTIGGIFGEQPFQALVGRLLCADTVVHTWDLARATGQDERLDKEGVARAAEFLAPIDEAIRRPGGFAPKIEPTPDADEQTRFLNFCGREV
jgi:uncharacterized protein (TIGR03086 family)